MRSFAVAVSALLFAAAAHAQDPARLATDAPDAPAAQAVEAPAPVASEVEVPAIEPRLAEEERPAADDAVVQAPFTPGSFWWYVGIIVVAGVILAVVL